MASSNNPHSVITFDSPPSQMASSNNPHSVITFEPPPSQMALQISSKIQSKQSKKPRVMLFIILYSCCRLKRIFLYFFGLVLILLAWGLSIGRDAKESKWINFVTNTLATGVIGTGIGILKVGILKVLACLYDKKFLDKVQDLIYGQYLLQTLLGVPAKGDGTLQLKWIKEACVNGKRLFILCDALNKTLDDDDDDGDETLINQEVETVVSQILKNLKRNELREIHEADLLQVMKEEDVANVLKLFEGDVETGVTKEASLKNWMVKVLNERKTLIRLLSDTNTAITELNTIMSWIVLFLVPIIWLCFMGFATNRVLAFIGSLVVLFFGKTCMIISDGIIFVFLQRTFDVGDCCVVDDDDELLIVEEMGILRTVFLTENNEKLYHQNSNLLTKSIRVLSKQAQE